MPHILTIDIGTSSARVMLFDGMGHAVAGVLAQESLFLTSAPDGTATMDIAATLDAVYRCVDTALIQAGQRANEIAAVALATFASSFVALGADRQPLTPLILYSDTRNTSDAVQLRGELAERTMHDATGCLLRTSYWPARLVWLRRTQPGIWQQAAYFATLGELLEQLLFGQSRVSNSVASWTGLLDRRTLDWYAPLLAHLGIMPAQLGRLVDASVPIRGLVAPFRARWPVLADIPWFPAIGDGAAANIGSGCVDAHTLALTVGTTGALRVVRPSVAQVPSGLWCYRVDARRALLGGATSEGGNVFAWTRATLRLDAADLEAALAAMPPDNHGLTILPLFAGERSPGWAGNARATISGITLSTTPLEIVRASLEAVAYRFAMIADTLIAGDPTPPAVIASGGALLRSPLWMQICADTLGIPMTASAEREGTSRGAALMALESLGTISSVVALPAALGATYQPDPVRHAIYRGAVERQRELYEKLILKDDAEC